MAGDEPQFDLQQVHHAEGERIFREGDAADALYLVVTGKVGLYRQCGDERLLVRTLGPGGVFGVTSFFDGRARSACAVTMEPSLLVRIPGNMIRQKLDRADPLLREVVATMANHLRDTTRTMQMRPRSVADYVRLVQEQTDNLRKFLINTHQMDEGAMLAGQVERLQAALWDLTEAANQIQDRRGDSLPDPNDLP